MISCLVSVVLAAAPVSAAIAMPEIGTYGPDIDGYAHYDVVMGDCSSVEQPGVVDFRAMLQRHYGANPGGITRACNPSVRSAHQSGRAYDWMLDAHRATDRAKADAVLDWLLATDEHGNHHAMARRLGVSYIIWNGQTWQAWDAAAGWKPYEGWSPHTDHVHFTFGWPGARRETSFWTAVPTRRAPSEISWLVGDITGDGTDDVVGFDPATGEWLVGDGHDRPIAVAGRFRTRTGWTEHVLGDFDGSGRQAILSFHAESGRWWLSR